MANTINVLCPQCGAMLEAEPDMLGKGVRCASCRKEFIAAIPRPAPVVITAINLSLGNVLDLTWKVFACAFVGGILCAAVYGVFMLALLKRIPQ